MILKEAYRYVNHIDSIIGAAESYLRTTNNVMRFTEIHQCSKAKPGAVDFQKDNVSDRVIAAPVNEVVNLIVTLLDEKEHLLNAIADAKREHIQVLDVQLQMNKSRRAFADTLKRMVALRSTDRVNRSVGYTFDVNGVQTPYNYDVQIKSRPDFDRKLVKTLLDSVSAASDSISTSADALLSTVSVSFVPTFSLSDTFEELMDEVAASNAAS